MTVPPPALLLFVFVGVQTAWLTKPDFPECHCMEHPGSDVILLHMEGLDEILFYMVTAGNLPDHTPGPGYAIPTVSNHIGTQSSYKLDELAYNYITLTRYFCYNL